MKLQLAFVLLTLLAGFKAVIARGRFRRLVWLFVVLNFGVLTLAYASRSPGIWAKASDGRVPLVRRCFLLPGHAVNQVIYHVFRAMTSSRPFDEIRPGLFLGRRLMGSEATIKEFRTVLDLTCEFTEPVRLRQATNYLCVPVLDLTPPTPAQLREALGFLAVHQADGPVLVHCAAGHGRSALVLAAFLLQQGKATNATEAMAQLRSARPNVKLNAAQREGLEEFARSLPINGLPRP